MRVTVHFGGKSTVYEVDDVFELRGDPTRFPGVVASDAYLAHRQEVARRRLSVGLPQEDAVSGSWQFHATPPTIELGPQTFATTLDGRAIEEGTRYELLGGSVVAAGTLTVTVGEPVEGPVVDPIEAALLGALARGEDGARLVLADHMNDHGDPARCALIRAQCEGEPASAMIEEHGMRWRRAAIDAGFAANELEFVHGFGPALVVGANESFAPAIFRLSPVVYRLSEPRVTTDTMVVHDATAMTATGSDREVTIKMAASWKSDLIEDVECELALLPRMQHPRLPKLRDVALSRFGRALVFDRWGPTLAAIVAATHTHQRAIPDAIATAIGIQVCDALAFLHSADVIHGELEPNKIVVRGGEITVHGFGIAIRTGGDQYDFVTRFRHYSSRERRGFGASKSADVFSIAMILAEMLDDPGEDAPSSVRTYIRANNTELVLPETPLRALVVDTLECLDQTRMSAASLGDALRRVVEELDTSPVAIARFVESL